MEVVLLSGAIKNAGDYLIVERSQQLLRKVFPEINIHTLPRKEDLSQYLEIINSSNVLILAGGPFYSANAYPKKIPLVKNLSDIRPKVFFLGGGWYGHAIEALYKYSFDEMMKMLLQRTIDDSKYLGCRDWYSVRVLQLNGLNQTLMTGCPAWYNLDYISSSRIRNGGAIKKIVVSDPANITFYGLQASSLLSLLRERFPSAKIEYVFHRGLEQDNLSIPSFTRHLTKFKTELDKNGILYHDISFSCNGFHVYDDCDLHIGYRVHAHIYNLSIRNRSILLEEDARGAGVNEALGLWPIRAYKDRKNISTDVLGKICSKYFGYYGKTNNFIYKDVSSYIDYVLNNDDKIYENAFQCMQGYYEVMIRHLKSIGEII